MIKFYKFFLLAIALFISCNTQVATNEFNFDKSDFVKFDNINLNQDQIRNLEIELSRLKRYEKEIYSKPEHLISYMINGEIEYISVFEKEDFVFSGYFLEAWTDRMTGKKSNGYKLSHNLKGFIKKLKIKTEPSVSF